MGAIKDEFNEVYRDFATDGVKSSGAHNPEKAAQRALGSTIEAAIALNLGNVSVAKTTAAALAADLAYGASSLALVYADPTNTNNDLWIKSGDPGTGAWTNTGALNAAFLDQLLAERDKVPSPWLPSVSNEYLRRLVKRGSIERGVAGRKYVLRYWADIAGSLHRVRFYLYDPVLDVQVAQKELQAEGDWPQQTTIFLTNAAAGSILPYKEWLGVSMTLWVDPSAYENGQIDIAVTDPAEAGIDPRNVLTRENVRDRLRFGQVENILYVNADGSADFLTVQEAAASLLEDPNSGRAWYPFSQIATPSNQYEIEIVGANHEEEWLENIVDQGGGALTAQGIILWEGLTLRVRHDTVMHTTGSETYEGPLFEMYGGRIIAPITARFEQRGYGYVGHIDAGNTLCGPATIGPERRTWQLVVTIDGGTWFGHAAHDDPIFGRGTSDDEDVLFTNGRTLRAAGNISSQPHYFSHTSPGSVFPGKTQFKNWNASDVGTPADAIALVKSHAQTVRHHLIVDNCGIGSISEDHSIGGDSAWVLVGALPAGVTIDGDLAV